MEFTDNTICIYENDTLKRKTTYKLSKQYWYGHIEDHGILITIADSDEEWSIEFYGQWYNSTGITITPGTRKSHCVCGCYAESFEPFRERK
jgi:hypothetical protein